jgi:hypothetical protein
MPSAVSWEYHGRPLGKDFRSCRWLPAYASAEQKWGIGMAYQISCVYASRNEPGRAMDWLERAYQSHDAGLISMLHDPMLKSLERDSRFQALLHKMHLSQRPI